MMNTIDEAADPQNATSHSVRSPERHGRFEAKVNDTIYSFSDPTPIGRQILGDAGFLPADDHILIQILRHGTRSIGLDETVDLREAGTEAFRAFKSDRVFRFTIDERGYDWGDVSITEPTLRSLSDTPADRVLVQETDDGDVDLEPGSVIDLGVRGTEHLHTSKHLVTVSLDSVDKTIPRGAYTTEELIRVLGVEAGYLLNVLKNGQLVALKPGETLRVKEGMKFFTQVPCGSSS
jgi:hypothetical protein